jgi:hypothetical protein
MTTCLCGNAIEQEGALCARCQALRTLGLDSNATRTDIETNYRLLVRVWHPDRFPGDPKLKSAAEETLKSINAAHAYIRSIPEIKVRGRPKPRPATREVAVQPIRKARHDTLGSLLASDILVRCGLLIIGLAIPALMLVGLDAWLSTNPTTATFYNPYRSRLLFALQTNVTEAAQSAERALHRFSPPNTAPSPRADTESSAAASPNASTDSASANSISPPHIPMPYVTVGLTKDEVMTVMGPPVSSAAGALTYRNAVFYLRKGVVVGWSIDPALIPLRVKLWPQGHVDPRLTTFTIGSTKNDVIAVQGTPTILSDDKLAYGGSEVFLEDARVIGWNDNHASQRLRIVSH